MTIELFAGIPVSDRSVAIPFYGQLLGSAPAFLPNDAEAVWELAEHRYVYVEERPGHAGHAKDTVIVDDLDERVAAIASRGLRPARSETYDNGVRKITFVDADGNELGFGGVPG